MNRPLLIAHRGDTVHYPENTIEAFQSAFEHGADGIECDIHLDSKDNLIVVHGYLYDTTKRYPYLSEVLDLFAHKGAIEIEVKSFNPLCVRKLTELLKEHQLSNYEITTSVLPLLQVIREYFPSAKTGMIFRSHLLETWMTPAIQLMFIQGYLELTKSNVLHLDHAKYTPEIIAELHKNNYLLHTHLKDANLDTFEKVSGLGIDQCTIDDIGLIAKVGLGKV